MTAPKFIIGDLVLVTIGTGDKEAIIIGYNHNPYPDACEHKYKLFIYLEGECAWFFESDLVLLKHDQCSLLEKWREELRKKDEMESDIDWIFSNGKSILSDASEPTVTTLGKYLGCNNLWGSRGEGFVYYGNMKLILTIAKPFLENSDKLGFLKFCEENVK